MRLGLWLATSCTRAPLPDAGTDPPEAADIRLLDPECRALEADDGRVPPSTSVGADPPGRVEGAARPARRDPLRDLDPAAVRRLLDEPLFRESGPSLGAEDLEVLGKGSTGR